MINEKQIEELLQTPEDGGKEFKVQKIDDDSLVKLLCAFSNADGGIIVFGIDDKTRTAKGLTDKDLDDINVQIGNLSYNNISPRIHPISINKVINGKKIVIIEIEKGNQKPYQTNKGVYYTRVGSTVKVMSQEELERIFYENPKIHYEELIVQNTNFKTDFNETKYSEYIKEKENNSLTIFLKENKIKLKTLLQNSKLLKNTNLTLLGLLYFGKNPQQFRPQFKIDAVHFVGDEFGGTNNEYISKEEITGTLPEQLSQAKIFLQKNLLHIQTKKNINAPSKLEINIDALEEAIVNALLHRNYGINSSIKIFIFKNRVEIISPGKLFNSLTIENILSGNTASRNPILVSFGRLLNYSGYGMGIKRIVTNAPNTEFINDELGNRFIVRIPRAKLKR